MYYIYVGESGMPYLTEKAENMKILVHKTPIKEEAENYLEWLKKEISKGFVK